MTMYSFIGILTVLLLVAFFVGMINPKFIMKWAPEEKRNRKWVIITTLAGLFVFGSLGNIVKPDKEQVTQQASQEQQLQKHETEKTAEGENLVNQTVQKSETSKSEKIEKIKAKVQEYVKANYDKTTVDSVTVNPDLGTEQDGDYVVLVNLTWQRKNSKKTSQEMLDMYSSDMAARMYKDLPEVQELAVFWKVPYLNNGSAKISFQRASDGMVYTDKVFDNNFR